MLHAYGVRLPLVSGVPLNHQRIHATCDALRHIEPASSGRPSVGARERMGWPEAMIAGGIHGVPWLVLEIGAI